LLLGNYGLAKGEVGLLASFTGLMVLLQLNSLILTYDSCCWSVVFLLLSSDFKLISVIGLLRVMLDDLENVFFIRFELTEWLVLN